MPTSARTLEFKADNLIRRELVPMNRPPSIWQEAATLRACAKETDKIVVCRVGVGKALTVGPLDARVATGMQVSSSGCDWGVYASGGVSTKGEGKESAFGLLALFGNKITVECTIKSPDQKIVSGKSTPELRAEVPFVSVQPDGASATNSTDTSVSITFIEVEAQITARTMESIESLERSACNPYNETIDLSPR